MTATNTPRKRGPSDVTPGIVVHNTNVSGQAAASIFRVDITPK